MAEGARISTHSFKCGQTDGTLSPTGLPAWSATMSEMDEKEQQASDFAFRIFERYMQALERTQWMPRADLKRYQQGLVEAVVRHAHTTVPFYRDRVSCVFGPDGSFDFTRWSDVPIVTREEAGRYAADMRSPELPDIYGPVVESRTSGSTSTSMPIAVNALVSIASNAALTRLARWWGIDTSRPLARIAIFPDGDAPAYPEGRKRERWSQESPQSGLFELDLTALPEQQIEWLLRKRAPYLMTSSSNAMALAYSATPEQARELSLEAVFAIAETVLPRARELVAERFGAIMPGVYSCQEVGFIATDCPDEPCYHVVAENVLVEIIDECGAPVNPGETGQVVLTSFYNYAMPFIRYAVGDVATAGPEMCRCGRTLPVIDQVDGRTRHAFVFKDGSRVWPRLWDFRVGDYVAFREFQLVQLDRERIELRYVPDGSGKPPDAAGLNAYLKQKLHASAETTLAPMAKIPRGPGGKLTPFISMVPD
jgi:phenylacetate-CoA ligase